MHDETLYAERALRAGASGYLMKSAASQELLEGMRRALGGDVVVSDKVSSMVLSRVFRQEAEDPGGSTVSSLSDRELQIFELVGTGARTREIAERLSVSAKTVDTHKSHIKRKLGLERSTDLLRAAMAWVSDQSD
jgi:DNA-binding NarL/FixJ family response regulator